MKHFELSEIHRVTQSGYEDFDAPLPGYGDSDMVESNPETIGTAMDIVKYLLKHYLHEYKIVKRKSPL